MLFVFNIYFSILGDYSFSITLVLHLSLYLNGRLLANYQLPARPNTVGLFGFLQPFADVLNWFLKKFVDVLGASSDIFYISSILALYHMQKLAGL